MAHDVSADVLVAVSARPSTADNRRSQRELIWHQNLDDSSLWDRALWHKNEGVGGVSSTGHGHRDNYWVACDLARFGRVGAIRGSLVNHEAIIEGLDGYISGWLRREGVLYPYEDDRHGQATYRGVRSAKDIVDLDDVAR